MKMQTPLNQYLLAKPTLRMVVEWPIIIIIGILGEIFSWGRIPLSPYSKLFITVRRGVVDETLR
jgi:hypothetical protein